MVSTAVSRVNGVSTSVAVKAPVHAVATTNVVLNGLQTVGGVVLDGDTLYRVLLTGQTNTTENGIWDADTGNWSRSDDFDGAGDVVKGTIVVAPNSSPMYYYRVTSADPITPGTTSITFSTQTGLDTLVSDLASGVAGLVNNGSIDYPQTDAESAAGVIPVNKQYPELELYRYGTNTTPGTTDMTTAITNGLAVCAQKTGGGVVKMPLDAVAYDGTISLAQGTGLVSQGAAYGGCKLIPLSASAIVVIDTQCRLENLYLYDAATRSGGVGISVGRAGNFEAFSVLRNVKVEGFEQNWVFDNSYFMDLEECEAKGGTYGITFNPTAGSGLGFNTTITLRKFYVHNCAYNGIRDLAATSSQQVSFRDVVVEECGDSTHAQVALTSSIAFSWDGGYIESTAATKPNGITCKNGVFRNFYVNGASYGIDGGSGACRIALENVNFTGIVTYPVNATGGANAYLIFRHVNFGSIAPNLSAKSIVYDHCDGMLPTGMDANSYEIAGSNPEFGVGGIANSKIKSIRFYTFTEGSITAAANTTTNGTGQSVGSGQLAGNTAVSAFPSTDVSLPTGVTAIPYKVSDNGFAMKYSNCTGTGQSVSGMVWYCMIVRFA